MFFFLLNAINLFLPRNTLEKKSIIWVNYNRHDAKRKIIDYKELKIKIAKLKP